MPEDLNFRGLRLAYLVSGHPNFSQSFVLREIMGLRQLGFEIEVISIAGPDRPLEQLSHLEREEVGRTFYVKRAGPWYYLYAHLSTLRRRPRGYVRALGSALALGGFDLRELVFNLVYFLQAGVIFDRLRRRRLAHFHAQFVSPAGLLATRFGGVGMSLGVHGPDEFFDVAGYHVYEKVRASTMISCISKFTRSQLMQLAPPRDWPKMEVVPLGVDPEEFAPAPFRESPAPFEILCVGRLIPRKGQRILLAAFEELVRTGYDVRLRLVGGGDDYLELKRLVAGSPRISLEGTVNQDHIRTFYRQADLFVLPSFAEGVPVVLMEAMAMGIACISTRVAGIPELIRDGIEGLLVAPSDVEGLAQAMARLIQDPEARRSFGQAGRRRVLEQYDLRTNIPKLAAVLARQVS